ncbi:glycosyltransferase [Algoriphagus formosus]|uniref:Glycosyltransferase family 1 protein n=1 Tax=Algoriphagus formosus TaxID=2007308 RepID=A0A4R5USS0_9BACT|nr:glycosyltransferase [Algoriphagus aquimaris]TDK42045.1 glycosyltransferase family 1 protein [Algoriphagus aquimaris]
MAKKKVLLILHYPPPIHGAGIMGDIIRKSERLKEEFHTRTIKIDSSVELHDIGRMSLKKVWLTLKFVIRVFWVVLAFRPNKVHYFSSSQGIAFYRDYLVSLSFKFLKVFNDLSIYYHYQAKYRLTKNWEMTISKWYFKNASIVVLSKELIEDFKVLPFWKKLSFYILPNTCKNLVSDDEFKSSLFFKNELDIVNFLYLSNMIPSKGYLEVLDVARYLNEKKVQALFSFAGDWMTKEDEEKFLKIVKELNLQNMIHIHGRVNDIQKKQLLSRAHFLIFPTRYPNEAFPLVLVEALQFGVLPITYINGGTPSIVNDNLGMLIKDNSLESLKNTALFASKRDRYMEKAFNARDKYLNDYRLFHFEKKLIDILNKEIEPVNLNNL